MERENNLIQEVEIEKLTAFVEDNKVIIRWKWPENSEVVYVYRTSDLTEASFEEIKEDNLKLYTKAEYREFSGYVETVKEIVEYKYVVFPARVVEGKLEIIKQFDERNRIILATGKPEIIYEIIEHRKFLASKKSVKIIIYADSPIDKEILCYVKKQGSYPVNKGDGVVYGFPNNFHAGKNELQPVEINKDEYIRVFFRDSKEFGRRYLLKGK